MEKKFIMVKSKVSELGVSGDTIVKVLEIIEYAEDNDVELYLHKGKLRMRYTGKTEDKKDGKGFSLDDFKDIFGMK